MIFLFKLCCWGSALAIAAFSLLPLGQMLPDILLDLLPFDLTSDAPGSDKFWHFIAYSVLGFFGYAGYRQAYSPIRLITAMFLYGVLMEGVQSLIPNRVMSALDIVANVGGTLSGVFVCLVLTVICGQIISARSRPASPE